MADPLRIAYSRKLLPENGTGTEKARNHIIFPVLIMWCPLLRGVGTAFAIGFDQLYKNTWQPYSFSSLRMSDFSRWRQILTGTAGFEANACAYFLNIETLK